MRSRKRSRCCRARQRDCGSSSMVRSSGPDRTQTLWAAALREAAGPLSAYMTPKAFALENLSVQILLDAEAEDFVAEIEARLDLGRADAFLQLLKESELVVTTAYRHVLSWSEGAVRGKIHVPRFVLCRARNETRGIPVILARRQVTTPENCWCLRPFASASLPLNCGNFAVALRHSMRQGSGMAYRPMKVLSPGMSCGRERGRLERIG